MNISKNTKISKISLDGRYIICSNGALIFDNETKEILNIEYIPLTEAQKIWDLADEVGIGLYYFGIHINIILKSRKRI
ncbi:HAD hydrolase family protein [Mycoplasmopsis felis]|nr:HAD hydrolase family protein [Mycoplasmopsis felis]WAM00949.1 HAD hydrolase family protein [Mycoplasmopsis felis]